MLKNTCHGPRPSRAVARLITTTKGVDDDVEQGDLDWSSGGESRASLHPVGDPDGKLSHRRGASLRGPERRAAGGLPTRRGLPGAGRGRRKQPHQGALGGGGGPDPNPELSGTG